MLLSLGQRLVQKDQNAARSMFEDFAFPRLATLINTYPTKRQLLLNIVYSYCASDAATRIGVIKVLQEKLCDSVSFLYCLTILVNMEDSFTDEMLDLYIYYCVMGTSHPSPALRAASVSMLPVIARNSLNQVLQMLGMCQML